MYSTFIIKTRLKLKNKEYVHIEHISRNHPNTVHVNKSSEDGRSDLVVAGALKATSRHNNSGREGGPASYGGGRRTYSARAPRHAHTLDTWRVAWRC